MKKVLLFALLLSSAIFAVAQIKTPAPSPTQTLKQDFALSSVEITYSRPAAKGRKIFGDLVPYGKMWRTGANGATRIKFGDDVVIGGKPLKAGEYALYSIPGESEWEIIVNKGVTNGGLTGYKPEEDVIRFNVKSEILKSPVESFTIELADVKSMSTELQLKWENTLVNIPITTEFDSKIMAQIDDVMNKDTKPYYQAALYYADNGKDLNQAVKWFDKAIEQTPQGYWIYHQKANALVKLGKKQEAKVAAQKSMALAREQKNADYVTLNEKLIAGLN